MAVSGIVLLGFVLAHMVGNLKVFLGAGDLNEYAEWLRDARRAGRSPAPSSCGSCGSGCIVAFVVHIVAAVRS